MATAAKRSVELFYDVISPYSWVGFEVMCRYKSVWNVDVKLKPFFLGGIMKGSNNKPPGMVPSKMQYMYHDMARIKQHYKIPLNPLSDPVTTLFKKGSMSAQRFITAVDLNHQELTEPLSREFSLRIWCNDEDITEKDSIIAAARAAGLSDAVIEEALSKMTSDTVKERLRQYTQEALDYGAFGAPTFLVEDKDGEKQMLFGSDRFHIMADILGEKYPGPMAYMASDQFVSLCDDVTQASKL